MMLLRVRTLAALLLVVALVGASAQMALAQSSSAPDAATTASAEKITKLLHASGYTFTQKTSTVWTINFNGKKLKDFRVIMATEGDLLVTFVIIAPNARLNVTDDFMRKLLRLNSKLDRIKTGLDQDGDLFVRIDSSVRVLDNEEFKAVVEQVSAATDEVYDEVQQYIRPA